MVPAAKNILIENTNILKSSVNKSALQGIVVAIGSIIVATGIVCYYSFESITLEGLLSVQQNNYALWVLDFMPFIFAYWGQYAGSIIAYQAGALLFDQTQELRFRADALEKKASYAATHDTSTDLPNRYMFYDLVEQAMAKCTGDRVLAVLLVEMENFKEINDTLGRNSSETLLKQVAQRLKNSIRGQDKLGRIDGNNFGVLLCDVSGVEGALEGARRIQQTLESPFSVERLKLEVQIGIGIVLHPDHGDDVDGLVQRAGVALYMANRSNHGYAVYEPAYDRHSPYRLTLMSELRQAIDKDSLSLYYQPKLCLKTETLVGVEALVRWHHPAHNLICPEEFVPQAEKTRMIRLLTSWVLGKAFSHCAEWHRKGLQFKVSINISVKDLYDPDLPDFVAKLAASTGVSPEWIIFEITESCISNDPERTLDIVGRLSRLGFHLSIDDFGTGYSSLAYLKKLPVSELKIDRSFVMDIPESDNDAVIVNATINLAHNLGLAVTAEGVESADVMEQLKSYGCDVVQGYYISKPMPYEEMSGWLKKAAWPVQRSDDINTGVSVRDPLLPIPD
ncbi:MAG: EAL domain-containing protein [Pseudomonadota bacterium]